ncbi:cytosine permease [Endozoicomonas gorgoniicola]|uniref:Cytosine permease n=1 Tax=Endozoicomonas gorgoniicola TaxID=1234144 RepID=A0ABT3MTF6_9GAMM|nr:cytosine permease [Endozoicomonas gorgoniicola]MCW7552373.1 cytosine permease [Endozoicomonas gorgoniicola]
MRSLITRFMPEIEVYGTQPVPENLRQAGSYDLFVIMTNFLVNPASIYSAALGVAGGLSFIAVVITQVVALFVAMVALLVMARMGVDYGLTGQMACRTALGVRGGRWLTSPLRAVCSVYWFAFQTLVSSLALTAILSEYFDIILPLTTVALLFAVLQVAVALVGYRWLQGVFSRALPLKILCLIIIVALLWKQPSASNNWFHLPAGNDWLLVMLWFNAVVGSMLTNVTDSADLVRYVKNRRCLWAGAMSGALCGVVLGAGLGAWLMMVVGGSADNLYHNVLRAEPGLLMVAAIVVLIVMDNWTINVINLYTGGLSLSHTLEPVSRFTCTLLISLPAIWLSGTPEVIHNYLQIMEKAGVLFSAIAGVLLVDYSCRKWQLNVDALYQVNGEYWYQYGFRISALLIIALASLAGFSVPDSWPLPLIVLLLSAGSYRLMLHCEARNHLVIKR